eukprot:TRINITY_DN69842_c0_g1_i1.p1 TRINITY_DN69842_c0_g1~~TRINITY_DN69842_c0_g1_i1.p1  ORF type:complete len:216 (+),score=18.26 TRINITY_DN69842_c0_g1_i1:196-843(+)
MNTFDFTSSINTASSLNKSTSSRKSSASRFAAISAGSSIAFFLLIFICTCVGARKIRARRHGASLAFAAVQFFAQQRQQPAHTNAIGASNQFPPYVGGAAVAPNNIAPTIFLGGSNPQQLNAGIIPGSFYPPPPPQQQPHYYGGNIPSNDPGVLPPAPAFHNQQHCYNPSLPNQDNMPPSFHADFHQPQTTAVFVPSAPSLPPTYVSDEIILHRH